MDFLKRDWINLSGWPLSKTELDQYYEQAKSYVEISTSIFDDRVWGEIGLDPNILNLNYKKIRTIFYRNSGFIKNKISYPVNFKKYLFNKKNKNIKD